MAEQVSNWILRNSGENKPWQSNSPVANMQFDGFWFNTWSPRASIVSQRVEDFCFELDEDNIDYVEFIENTAKKKKRPSFLPKSFCSCCWQVPHVAIPVWKGRRGGGGVLGLIFAGYVPLTSQSPYLIIVHSVADYRPHLSHSWADM